MRKPEQRLADRVRDNIGTRVLIKRVENSIAAGTPDSVVLSRAARRQGRVTWAEHKVIDWPAKSSTRIQFLHPPTIDQINWHLEWTQAGGNSIFLIGARDPAGLYAVPGSAADEVSNLKPSELIIWAVDYDELVHFYRTGRMPK